MANPGQPTLTMEPWLNMGNKKSRDLAFFANPESLEHSRELLVSDIYLFNKELAACLRKSV